MERCMKLSVKLAKQSLNQKRNWKNTCVDYILEIQAINPYTWKTGLCIRVYDSGLEKEIALLHSTYCGKCKPCADFPPSFKRGAKYKDDNELIHLHAGIYFKRNATPEVVDWDVLNFNIFYYEEWTGYSVNISIL